MNKKAHTWAEHEKELLAQGRITEEEMAIQKLKMDFSCLVYDLRMRHKLTQRELAKRMGVRQQQVAKIETGEENLSLETIGKLLIAFRSVLKVAVTARTGRLTNVMELAG